ncbi:MAG: alpha/beta fold hydrolase [Clostridia bacterium]|nr:alpha/beta fold hydrolase [Clostridia bacterium]
MKIFLEILAAAAGLWLLFVFIPTLTVFVILFGRKGCRSFSPEHLETSYYAPFRDRIVEATRKLSELPCRELSCSAPDGTRLSGRLLGEPGKTVILAHGYRSAGGSPLAVQALRFAERGWAVLLPDQRAHGNSGGRFTTMGILESGDLRRWAELASSLPGNRRTAVYGMSMGATSAAFASADIAADAMVLDCPFDSPSDQLRRICRDRRLPAFLIVPAGILIARLLCRVDFSLRASDVLRKARVPALFICGSADSTVPPDGVREMSDACPTSAGCVLVEGAEHSVAFLAGGEELAERVERFISGRDR